MGMRIVYGNLPLLTAREERELIIRAQADDRQALDRLIQTNIRLVYSIARSVSRLQISKGLELDDLVIEGVIGLMRAIEMYKVDRGTKLSTYATLWISRTIRRAIEQQAQLIRLPAKSFEIRMALLRRLASFSETNFRQPDEAELETIYEELASQYRASKCLLVTLAEQKVTQSLDQPVTLQGALLAERLTDHSASPYDMIIAEEERSWLTAAVDKLKPRYRSVIILYYGLDGEKRTLREVARELGIPAEAVRQRVVRALLTLRENIGLG